MIHLGVGTVAYMSLWFLSVPAFIILSGCLAIGAPESEDGEITPRGKMLLRAKYSFTAACVLIFVCLALDFFVKNPRDRFSWGWLWDEYPRVLVLLLMLSSGLSVAASSFGFQSKGNGRWVFWVGGPIMAAFSLIAAIAVGQSI